MMGTAGWVCLVVALLAVAAFVVTLIYFLRQPKDAKLLKAIDDATQARRAAEVREHQYTAMVDSLRREISDIRRIKDEKQRLSALAALANRLKR